MAHTHMMSTSFSEPLKSRISFTPIVHTINIAFHTHPWQPSETALRTWGTIAATDGRSLRSLRLRAAHHWLDALLLHLLAPQHSRLHALQLAVVLVIVSEGVVDLLEGDDEKFFAYMTLDGEDNGAKTGSSSLLVRVERRWRCEHCAEEINRQREGDKPLAGAVSILDATARYTLI